MEDSSIEFSVLSISDLLLINSDMIYSYGGFYEEKVKNVNNRNSLYYLIESIEAKIFGQYLYPTFYSKAAAYIFFIIKDHIFLDGNKRTGLQAAIQFLEQNGLELVEEVTDEDLVNLANNIDASRLSFKEIENWFRLNTKQST